MRTAPKLAEPILFREQKITFDIGRLIDILEDRRLKAESKAESKEEEEDDEDDEEDEEDDEDDASVGEEEADLRDVISKFGDLLGGQLKEEEQEAGNDADLDSWYKPSEKRIKIDKYAAIAKWWTMIQEGKVELELLLETTRAVWKLITE